MAIESTADTLAALGVGPLSAEQPRLLEQQNGPTRIVPGSHKRVPIDVPDVNMAMLAPDLVEATMAGRTYAVSLLAELEWPLPACREEQWRLFPTASI